MARMARGRGPPCACRLRLAKPRRPRRGNCCLQHRGARRRSRWPLRSTVCQLQLARPRLAAARGPWERCASSLAAAARPPSGSICSWRWPTTATATPCAPARGCHHAEPRCMRPSPKDGHRATGAMQSWTPGGMQERRQHARAAPTAKCRGGGARRMLPNAVKPEAGFAGETQHPTRNRPSDGTPAVAAQRCAPHTIEGRRGDATHLAKHCPPAPPSGRGRHRALPACASEPNTTSGGHGELAHGEQLQRSHRSPCSATWTARDSTRRTHGPIPIGKGNSFGPLLGHRPENHARPQLRPRPQ